MRAAYRNSRESRSENSIPCRQPVNGPSLRLELQQTRPQRRAFTAGEVRTDLEQLCEMGLLEPYIDEHHIVRYKAYGWKGRMNLPITEPFFAVGSESGDGTSLGGESVAVLDSDICRDAVWCANCGGPQTFVAMYEFAGGRVGVCLGCGDERVARFTRAISEVA